MTLYQFQLLDKSQQSKVWSEGVYVGERLQPEGTFIVCRQIDDFYVEGKIDGIAWNIIRCFKNPDLLEPYLSQIDIAGLGI
jgi:hypothetical protein